MNDDVIIEHMISFIEQKERSLQSEKTITDNRSKSDIVKAILDELEREMSK